MKRSQPIAALPCSPHELTGEAPPWHAQQAGMRINLFEIPNKLAERQAELIEI